MPITSTSQTIGPYWHLLEYEGWNDLTRFGATGEVITIEGHVLDGSGAAMTDTCVELWQASPAAANFQGFGRAATDAAGRFTFKTLMPEPLPGPGNAWQAPHVALTLMARGLLIHVTTRVYFEGRPENEQDPILGLVEPERRGTLIAKSQGRNAWRLDLHMQGEEETVFFEV